jgi:NAD(P)-dependent dehydrogenase (short-subunit alcohol dehydrogenase family)
VTAVVKLDNRLAGQVSVVTGGGGNIGRAISLRLAAEGAPVAVVDKDLPSAQNTVQLITDAGGTAAAVEADVRTRPAVQAFVTETVDKLGEIDILVNCAGVDHSLEPLEITDDLWDEVVETNLRGPFLVSQTVIERWQGAGRGGVIVNIASVESVMPFPKQVHYAASKGGVLMLTRALAHDVARHGIRVNAVGPGTIPRRHESLDKYDGYVDQYPLGRLGTGADIAAAVAFLASDDSSWVTGQTIYVDGGWLVR